MSDEKQAREDTPQPYDSAGLHQLHQSFRFRPVPLLIGVFISVLLLWLAFREIELTEVIITFNNLHWGFVVLALVLSIVATFSRAARWRLLLEPDVQMVPFLHLTSVLFFSQMLNILIPLRAGEFARILLIQPISKVHTLGSIFIEKFLDLLTLAAFLLVLPLTLSLPEWFRESIQSLLLITLAVLIMLSLLFFLKDKLLSLYSKLINKLHFGWRHRLGNALAYGLKSLDVFHKPWISLRLQMWSFLIWGMGFLVNYVVFKAVRLDLPMSAALFLLLVLQVGVSLPNIPGKLGVFQYATILALSVFQVEKSIALSYSLVLYLVGFGPHLIFGTLIGWRFLLQNRKEKIA